MDFIAKNIVTRRLQAFREIMGSCSVLDIIEQMKIDRVFDENDKIAILGSHDKPEELFIRLEKAKKAQKINILDYRWQLLPWIEVELIIATDNGIHRYGHKEP
jgi:hypothetical protein